jgi:hypothetical protein
MPPCIKKIEVSLQVENEPWFINIQREDLILNSNLNKLHNRGTVENCSCIMTLGVSQPTPLKEILT